LGFWDQLHYEFEPVDVGIFFTLLLLEAVLSFDNAAVIAALVRRLPKEQRRRALFYGLAGAYTFRIIAILLASFLIQHPILRFIGGTYLVFLAAKHILAFRKSDDVHDELSPLGQPRRFLGMSPFWATVVTVESADIVFALDQIVVAVAFTQKIPLIIVAAMVAILFLRLAAIFIIRLMDWFPPLETLAYIAVGWVGLKLVATEAFHYFGYTDFQVPKMISIGVTLTVLALPLLGKLVLDLVRGRLGRQRAADVVEPEK
jgi:YkoY family integral membrane protein